MHARSFLLNETFLCNNENVETPSLGPCVQPINTLPFFILFLFNNFKAKP